MPISQYLTEKSWQQVLASEFCKPYFTRLNDFVENEYETRTIFPDKPLIFNALNLCAFDNVKVVIIGQDPYHGEGQAHGLSFSVNENVKIPPSLRNIYKEIQSDLAIETLPHGNLTRWATQGVLLLNATLTVRAEHAGSHQKKGWEHFTDAAIRAISEQRQHVVFMLWGNFAQQKATLIDQNRHLVLQSVHPSPLSANRGWFGCCHFSQANNYLTHNNLTPINWR